MMAPMIIKGSSETMIIVKPRNTRNNPVMAVVNVSDKSIPGGVNGGGGLKSRTVIMDMATFLSR